MSYELKAVGSQSGEETKMKAKRKIIEIDEEKCNGCGQCVEACAEGAIQLVNGKAKLVADIYCDGLAACVGECPVDALKIVERDAEAFDAEAAEQFVQHLKTQNSKLQTGGAAPCGCPSTKLEMFGSPCETSNKSVFHTNTNSVLTHWPIQIKLVPPFAPFLQKVHLLVASDCTPIAYPDFHKDFLKGRVVLVGCPKFDDVPAYVEKFTQIFRQNPIKSVVVLVMEVPCCQGLPAIIRKAMDQSGQKIPSSVAVVSLRGEILKSTAL